jgi:hypothetical protein
MKFIVIGDIHGKSVWKKIGDIEYLLSVDYCVDFDYDKYIFLGDYCDAFDKNGREIIDNLIEIINFKLKYSDRVELLLGNHDLQYMFDYKNHGCSGFNGLFYLELNEIFRKYRDCFKACYGYNNMLFTHAGVTESWFDYEFPYNQCRLNIADNLNKAFNEKVKTLFNVSHYRGGFQMYGGIFWADLNELITDPLIGYHQVVGHTRVKEIFTETFDKNTSITFIDVLDNNQPHAYVIEI